MMIIIIHVFGIAAPFIEIKFTKGFSKEETLKHTKPKAAQH